MRNALAALAILSTGCAPIPAPDTREYVIELVQIDQNGEQYMDYPEIYKGFADCTAAAYLYTQTYPHAESVTCVPMHRS